MQRTKAHYTRKKRSQEQGDSCTNRDLDSSVHSYRSLVSETQQITGKSSWGRTFSSLHRNNRSPSPTERTKIPGSPSTSPRSVKSTNIDGIALCSMMARDKLRSPTPTSIRSNSEDDLASSFTVEELSAIALEGDNWQGTVTIGLGALQENVPPSPDQRSVRSLKLLNVPMTPPRLKKMSKKLVGSPKKTKQKRRKKSRGEKSKGSAAPVAWGDYAMAQNMTALHQREFSEKGRSGRTDGRRLKKKLLFDAFFEDNDHERGTTVAWGELLEICDPDEFRPTAVGNFDQSVLGRLSSLNLPDSPPSIMYDEDSFLGRFHAAHAQKRQEYCDESSQEDRLDDSMSTQCEETKTTKEDLEGNEDRRSSRLICFADEQGLPIERVRRVGDENDPWAMGRIIVLFLDPIARKFEFMQGEFSHRAGATVSDLLRQLPSFATEDRFATMEFSAMYSTSGPTRQFGLNEKLYELQLDRLEVTIAVMKGYSGENLLKEAAPVLKNKNIIRAVSIPAFGSPRNRTHFSFSFSTYTNR